MEELYKKNEIENLSFEQILEREGAGEEETNETVGQTLYDPDVQTTHLNNLLLGNDTGRLITTGTDNTFVGFQAGFSDTAGYDNFFAGSRAGYFNTVGYNNCFIGSSSGQFTITGYDNIAIGNAAMQGLAGSSGDGHDNTIMGFGAGYMLTSGHDNITVGNQSLGGQNTPPNYMTGSFNVCMGRASGAILTSGLNNVFLGTTSGYKSTSGYNNVYIGDRSGYFGTGHNNVYLGGNTGFGNQTGSDNVFLGFQAGYYETGSNKFFLDSWARGNEADARVTALMYGIFASTTANQHLYLNGNVYISDTLTIGGTAISSLYQPLDSDLTAIAGLSSADGNIIVGSAGGWVAESGATARTSLGLGTGSNPSFASMSLGTTGLKIRDTSAAYDVIITATSSTALTQERTLTLDLVNAVRTLKLGGDLTVNGNSVIDQDVSTAGSPTFNILATISRTNDAETGPTMNFNKKRITGGNVASGDSCGTHSFSGWISDGYYQFAQIKAEVDATPGVGDYPGRIVFLTTTDGASAPSEKFRINNAGKITTLPTYSVTVGATNRDLYIDNTGVIGYVSSSIRYKENVKMLDSSRIYALNPVSYTYKSDKEHTEQYGLIAEEVNEIFPELVSYDKEGRPETVGYNKLIPLFLNEIKTLNERIKALEAK